MQKVIILIHGGAGNIQIKNSGEQYKQHLEGLTKSLEAGRKVLLAGKTAIEAVTAAVMTLEDCPLFNAGKGSVFTHDEKNEMDAAIMDGKTLANGAVCGIRNIKNPILLAKEILLYPDHSFLSGSGAEQFAEEKGLEIVEAKYFKTELRYAQLLKAKGDNNTALDHDLEIKKYGTVGAVALDSQGNLAAATSTGGITNKKYGRIGDTPIIGSGTFADNHTCAISCTGQGEQFIKLNVAYDIAAQMKYQNCSLQTAANNNINHRLNQGDGGLIAIDKQGNYAMPFNSTGMFRGIYSSDGIFEVKIW